MAFFLIGQGPDGDIRLLSSKQFETRQAAMAELSILSSDPSFEHWDADVSVMDLATGAPVLLVRPAAAEAAPDLEAVPVADSTVWPVEAPADDAVAPIALVDVVEPLAETPEPIVGAIEAPFWEPPATALIEPVSDAAIADAIVAEALEPSPDVEAFAYVEPVSQGEVALEQPASELVVEPEPEPESAVEAASEAPSEPEVFAESEPAVLEPELAPELEPVLSDADENDDLRAAILRTTQHMAAEGIVPPESIGPAPLADTDAEAAEGLEPEAVDPAPEPAALASQESNVEDSADAASGFSAAAPDVEAYAPVGDIEVPTEVEPAADLPVATVPESPAPERSLVGFWPWNKTAAKEPESGVAPEVADVYQALEEPALELPDVEAALPRPVMSAIAQAEASDEAPAREPMSSIPVAALVGEADAIPAESDFILDLDNVEQPQDETEPVDDAPVVEPASQAPPVEPSASASVAAGEPEPPRVVLTEAAPSAQAVSPLEDFTCEDCVYVDTCPNRDQRLPKDCGSFQWR